MPEAPAEAGGRGAPPVAAAGPPLRGTVAIADSLAGRARENAVLFLIARSGAAGPPRAGKRIPGPRFPLDFSIAAEDRMIPTLPFAGPLRITARLDTDGDAGTRTPGDLQGTAPGAYEPGATGIEVVLDEVL
jgi:hypothetical protein